MQGVKKICATKIEEYTNALRWGQWNYNNFDDELLLFAIFDLVNSIYRIMILQLIISRQLDFRW